MSGMPPFSISGVRSGSSLCLCPRGDTAPVTHRFGCLSLTQAAEEFFCCSLLY